MATRRARGLRPLILSSRAGSSSEPRTRAQSLTSIDLDPAQREFLDFSSPYHDGFSAAPSTPYHTQGNPATRRRSNPFISLMKSFSFRGIGISTSSSNSKPDDDAEKASASSDPDPDSDSECGSPTRSANHAHWHTSHHHDDTHDDPNWTSIPLLLLLLSVVLNFFLLFNGPPSRIPVPLHPKKLIPHRGFHFRDRGGGYGAGRNYTCYETRARRLGEDWEFVSLGRAYDFLWREALGGSQGFLYADVGGEETEGKSGKGARLAMFHQLECLGGLRSAVQTLRDGHLYLDVDVDVRGVGDYADVDGYLGGCLDYLRQVALCHADDNLELAGGLDGGRRQCRDSSWLYDVTACGETGCPGKPFYRDDEELGRLRLEE